MTSPFAPPRELMNALRTSLSPRSVEIPVIPQPSGQPQLAHRNNNPGNLRFAGQRGAEPGDKGFARFNSPEEGYEALLQQVRKDQARGLPLGAFIAKYAPATENDTGLYIRQAAAKLNVDPGTLIDELPTEALAEFMARKESGATVTKLPTETFDDYLMRGDMTQTGTSPMEAQQERRALAESRIDVEAKRSEWLAELYTSSMADSTYQLAGVPKMLRGMPLSQAMSGSPNAGEVIPGNDFLYMNPLRSIWEEGNPWGVQVSHGHKDPRDTFLHEQGHRYMGGATGEPGAEAFRSAFDLLSRTGQSTVNLGKQLASAEQSVPGTREAVTRLLKDKSRLFAGHPLSQF